MAVIICSLLAIGALGFTLLVRDKDIPPAPVENPQLKELELRRQVVYDNLKDLQFEFHQGKLSDEDYQSLKAGFLYDLAGIMDAIERLQSVKGSVGRPGKVEAKSEAKKKAKSTSTAILETDAPCTSCGASNPLSSRFCSQCGKALQ